MDEHLSIGQRIILWRVIFVLSVSSVVATSARAQELPPIRVTTFNREYTNWATARERRFDFPDASVPIEKITMTLRLDCPSGGCDPWDRGATVFVRGRNPSGQFEPFEITRFITPYGTGCSWQADVTDYRPFLAGNASLGFYIETWIGGTQGWLVTLRFDFYPGEPEREVLSIQNIWHGKPEFGNPDNPIDRFFNSRGLTIDPSASAAKLRFFVTGHGQGNTDNAAEFARKRHTVRVNADRFEHDLWRSDCELNPCSPQGGTWQLDRAGWCPGDIAEPWDVDITDSVAPGERATIRYEVEAYTNRCRPSGTCNSGDCIWGNCDYDQNGHTTPIYWVESQLITYRSPVPAGETYSFQEGVDGYTGTVDTGLLESAPLSSRATSKSLYVTGDDGLGHAAQALLLFENIFGEGPGRIPPGAPIRSARLELDSLNSGDGAAVHRMLTEWSDADTWASFGGDGIQAGIEALAEPDGIADASGGGEVSVDVTKSMIEQGRGGPATGWALLPRGGKGWNFSSSESSSPPRLVVETGPLIDDVLISVGDEWDYFKGTRAPPVSWNQVDFVPSAGWARGATGIGYGDSDDQTVLSDMSGRYASVFCRREFELGAYVSALRLRIDYDDGFLTFLN